MKAVPLRWADAGWARDVINQGICFIRTQESSAASLVTDRSRTRGPPNGNLRCIVSLQGSVKSLHGQLLAARRRRRSTSATMTITTMAIMATIAILMST
jgi:hypothetical protein